MRRWCRTENEWNGCEYEHSAVAQMCKLHKYYIRIVPIENLSHARLIKTEGELPIAAATSSNTCMCMENVVAHKINNDGL